MIQKITVILFVAIFLYVIAISTSPLKPTRLRGKYSVCDIGNMTSWQIAATGAKKITSTAVPSTDEKNIEFVYEDLIPKVYSYIECKTSIPVDILYKAITLNAVIKTNQPIQLGFTIKRVGQGPFLGDILIKTEDVNRIITISKLLDNQPKLTWLSGDYDTGALSFITSDPKKPLILTIYDVYLE